MRECVYAHLKWIQKNMILSIIIPVYKVEKYIAKCLESIVRQIGSINDVEIIIVNDGTPDNSMEIVEKYAHDNEYIKIINQENQGLSGARNTGIKKAIGDFIWFVDSDDWIEEGFIYRVLPVLKKTDRDILIFRIREYDENVGERGLRNVLHETNEIQCTGLEAMKMSSLYHMDLTPIQEHIIRRAFILEHGLFFKQGIYHEDVEIVPRLFLRTDKVAFVPWVHYCYLWRQSGSITSTPQNLKKRVWSYFQIYLSLSEEKKKFNDSNKIKILNQKRMSMVMKIWNNLSLDDQELMKDEYQLDIIIPELRHWLVKNIFTDKYIGSIIRRAIFIVSPKILKTLKKNL